MFERLIRVIGMDSFEKLQNSNILLVGVGGVGGYAFEALVRSGIGHITVIDYDVIEESNINRQIIATLSTIGKMKVDVIKERGLLINSNCDIRTISKKLDSNSITELPLSEYDFIIDACDDTLVKKSLIVGSFNANIPIISCMGTGNRTHPELLKIQKLSNTKNDPLAKKMRSLLSKEDKKYLSAMVLCSEELPIKTDALGTVCPVPMAAGSILASYVIQSLIN